MKNLIRENQEHRKELGKFKPLRENLRLKAVVANLGWGFVGNVGGIFLSVCFARKTVGTLIHKFLTKLIESESM